MNLTRPVTPPPRTEAEIEVRMREDFSKVCFETLLQFSFSNKASTPQEGLISRMALAVLLQRSQDVLRRYVEDERLSGRCPLPRYVTASVRSLTSCWQCVTFDPVCRATSPVFDPPSGPEQFT